MALHMLEWLGEMELKIAAGNQWNSLQVIAKAVTDCQQKATQWIPHAQKPLSGAFLCPQTGISTISPSTETSSQTFLSSSSLGHALHWLHCLMLLGNMGKQGWTPGHGGQSLPAPSSLSFTLTFLHSPLACPLPKKTKWNPAPAPSSSPLQHTFQCCWMR